MTWLTIMLILVFILMVVLIAIGFKYPYGRKDWPLDRKTTAMIFLSVLIFLLLIALSYFASQHINWPSRVEIFFVVGIIMFIILGIIAILMPEGLEEGGRLIKER